MVVLNRKQLFPMTLSLIAIDPMANISILGTLEAYKKLTQVQKNQAQLLKEKTIVLYVATLLENENEEILALCLDILENFMGNDNTHDILMKTFGVFEALESLSIRSRRSKNVTLAKRSGEMVDILINSTPPAYSTRNRSKMKTFVYLFEIHELDEDNRSELNEILVKIKGIVSFVVDLEKKRCTVRIGPNIAIEDLVAKITKLSGMTVYLVKKSADKNETLIDMRNQVLSHPEYFPDQDSPPRRNALTTITGAQNTGKGFLNNVVDFWAESFYW